MYAIFFPAQNQYFCGIRGWTTDIEDAIHYSTKKQARDTMDQMLAFDLEIKEVEQ